MTPGILETIDHIILKKLPIDPMYARAISYCLLSTAMGSGVYFEDVLGTVKSNQNFIVIAPSGLGFKSTPIREFIRPVLSNMEQNLGRKFSLPSKITTEGITKYLNDPTNNVEGLTYLEEFTALLKGTKSKSYMSDLIEIYSEVYDGYIQTRYTVGHQLQRVDHVFSPLLALSSYHIFDILDKYFIYQGLGNRYLWIFPEIIKVKKYTKDEFFPANNLKDFSGAEEISNILIGIYKRFINQKDNRVTRKFEMKLTDEAKEYYTAYYNSCTKEADEEFKKDKKNYSKHYVQRMPLFVGKLALIEAISRNWGKSNEINLDDIKNAKVYVEKCDKHMERVYTEIQLQADEIKPKSNVRIFDRVLAMIRKAGGWIRSGELKNKLGIPRDEYDDIIQQLANSDKVIVFEKLKTGSRGRASSVIFLPESTAKDRIIKDDKGNDVLLTEQQLVTKKY